MESTDSMDTLKGDELTVKRKENVLLALIETHGIVTPAINAAHVARSTFYQWKEQDPVFKQAVNDTAEIAIDEVESAFFDNIKAGNVTAQIFYLKTRAKHRGYVERVEVATIEQLQELDDTQLDQYIAGVPYSQLVANTAVH